MSSQSSSADTVPGVCQPQSSDWLVSWRSVSGKSYKPPEKEEECGHKLGPVNDPERKHFS